MIVSCYWNEAVELMTCLTKVMPDSQSECFKIADLLLGWIGSRQSELRDYGRQAERTSHSARFASRGINATVCCKCYCSIESSLTACPGLFKVGTAVKCQGAHQDLSTNDIIAPYYTWHLEPFKTALCSVSSACLDLDFQNKRLILCLV